MHGLMAPAMQTQPEPVRATIRWAVTAAATVVSTCALDITATAAGALLVASGTLHGLSHGTALGLLATTYLLWAAGLRVNLVANWCLLEHTGTSTNLPSKVMFELARLRSNSRRATRAASAVGYVATEIAKEAPYYAGAFGAATVSTTVSSRDALVFIAGTNIGAAAYEVGLARLSRAFLSRRPQP